MSKANEFVRLFAGLWGFRIIFMALNVFCFKILWALGNLRFRLLVKNGGKGSVCHWSVTFKCPENIKLGDRVVIGPNTTLGAEGGIEIGSDVRISEGVIVETGGLKIEESYPYRHESKAIKIGDGVWLGSRSIILQGVEIGAGSVIAAGALVNKDLPPNGIYAGIPAKYIKDRVVNNE